MNMVQKVEDGQIRLETDRLSLRLPRQSDAGLVGLYANDIRVSGPTRSIPHPMPPGAAEAFIAQSLKSERTEDVWIMDGTKSGLPEVVGVIGLEHLDRNQSRIGYWLAPAFWAQGFAREAVGAILDANPNDDTTIFADVFQDNDRSAKLLTDKGFLYLGDAEAYCVARHQTLDTWTYSKRMT